MKRNTLFKSSILMVALLGTGVVANAVLDNEKITGEKVFSGKKGLEPKAITGEEVGVYKEWQQYSAKYYTDIYHSKDIYVNYMLDTDNDGNQTYNIGFILPHLSGGSSTSDWDEFFQTFVENPDTLELRMQDINKMPDSGWDAAGFEENPTKESIYSPVIIEDDSPSSRIQTFATAAEWPFTLDSTDIFDGEPYDQYHHILYSIPLVSTPGDPYEDGTYTWYDSPSISQSGWTTSSMHTNSAFAVKQMRFSSKNETSNGMDSLVLYLLANANNSSSADSEIAERLSDRDKSLWLKYPEPVISIKNATEGSDGKMEIVDGSFADGYQVDLNYDHTVTPEEYSIVHSIDYTLWGPSTKGSTGQDVMWDHIHLDDTEATREYRTSTEDPDATNFVQLGQNTAASDWFDGTDDGDMNIATTTPVEYFIGDPNMTTGESAPKYTTGYLFSDSEYRIDIAVDGETTPDGAANSFTWPESKMNFDVRLVTDVYEPDAPVVLKFEQVTDPLHTADGKIQATWAYEIDTKVDAEFDGTGFYPTGLEYIEVTNAAGDRVVTPPTAIDQSAINPTDGKISGEILLEDLPANTADQEIMLKLHYGAGVGNVNGDTVDETQYWTLNDDKLHGHVATGNRGSVDYDSALEVVNINSTSAELKLTPTAIPTKGTEDSWTTWTSDWTSSYATSPITSATITAISGKPDDVTNDDLTTWDQDETFTNNVSWDLNQTQIDELNAGSSTVTVDGLIPNEDYTFVAEFTYDGETKPAGADDRWDSSWEAERTATSNEISLHSTTDRAFQPENIEMSYEFVPTWGYDERSFRSQYTISMDVQDGDKGIYSASNVESIEFSSPNLASTSFDGVVTEEIANNHPEGSDANAEYWASWEQVGNRLTVTLSVKNSSEINDTVSAKINYAGGQIVTFDGKGTQPNLEASTSIPDRGNYDVVVNEAPKAISQTKDSITFQGSINEIIPEGTKENASTAYDQYAKNENFSILEVSAKDSAGIISDSLEFENETWTSTDYVYDGSNGNAVATHTFEFTVVNLNPNKTYDLETQISYNGTSKVADNGQFSDVTEIDNVNEQKIVVADIDDTVDGTTDTLGILQPELTIISDEPVILVDESTRNLSASGQMSISSVSEDKANGFLSDYSATELEEVRIMDGTTAVYTYVVSDEERKTADLITIDWTIEEEFLEAKTDYNLVVQADYAKEDGSTQTHTYEQEAYHIVFNTGSRGDLSYDDVSVEVKDNVAGPLLTLGYSIDYSGDGGHDYADFNLLKVDHVEVNAWSMQNLYWKGEGSSENLWLPNDEPLITIDGFTYDGSQKEIVLGYDELIGTLDRWPGAPETPKPEDDQNGDGVYDKAYNYKFTVSVFGEFPDGSTELESSGALEFDQFSFEKGGWAPMFRDFEMGDIVVSEDEEPTGSVSGSFWVEHRPEGFYDGMEGHGYDDFDEIDMWSSGLKSIALYDVTDPARVISPTIDANENVTDTGTTEPLDQEIWLGDGSGTDYPDFFDAPDSYDMTPDANGDNGYDAWLAEDHTKTSFTIDGLTPGETYKFKLIAHYSGDDIDNSHSTTQVGGYDTVREIEIAVPFAGVEEFVETDIQFSSAKSSLTTWSLSYKVTNLEVDPRYEAWQFNNISIVDANNELITTSENSGGTLLVENMMPGTNPLNMGWKLVVNTTGDSEAGQTIEIELNEDWARNTKTIEGKDIATETDNGDGTFSYDWVGSELDATESWDILEPVLGDDFKIGNVDSESFTLSVTRNSSYAQLVASGELYEDSFALIDRATGKELDAEILNPIGGGTKSSDRLEIKVTGVKIGSTYGQEGFDVQFSVLDKYAPNAVGEIAMVLASTEALPVEIPSTVITKLIVGTSISLSILIPIILLVLFLLWWFMLSWRKEKETEFKPGQVTFRLNKLNDADGEKLNGAKLQDANETQLAYTTSVEKETDKILVTVTGVKGEEPLKGLKFIVDQSTVEASNKKVEANNAKAEAKFEEDMKAYEAAMADLEKTQDAAIEKWNAEVAKWEAAKAKAAEAGKEFTTEKPAKPAAGEKPAKPAKPALEKLAKPNKDIKVVGSVKVVAPAPKEPKPAKEVKPAKEPKAPKEEKPKEAKPAAKPAATKKPPVKKPTTEKEKKEAEEKAKAKGSAEIIMD